MRNLTITRRKSFVGCAMKDRVYVEDTLAPELTIDGVPCRKIGEIKNGETKTFSVGEEEQKIFLISDKVSKDYCHGTATIPEGQEDVALSGEHKFVFGSNPFRFDGMELSPEQVARQKKKGRIGMVIMVAAMVFGMIMGKAAVRLLLGNAGSSLETYTKGDFSITMASNLEEEQVDGFDMFYRSKSVMVFGLREEKQFFLAETTLEDYGSFVLEANGKTQLQLNREDDLIWFEYKDQPEGQEIYYFVVCCEDADAFWIVNFVTPAENVDQYKDDFLAWAKTIELD